MLFPTFTSLQPLTTVLLFGLPREFVEECQIAGRNLSSRFVPVRDLNAACRAIARGEAHLIVASNSLPFWDKLVVKEHAERNKVPLTLINREEIVDVHPRLLDWERRSQNYIRR